MHAHRVFASNMLDNMKHCVAIGGIDCDEVAVALAVAEVVTGG